MGYSPQGEIIMTVLANGKKLCSFPEEHWEDERKGIKFAYNVDSDQPHCFSSRDAARKVNSAYERLTQFQELTYEIWLSESCEELSEEAFKHERKIESYLEKKLQDAQDLMRTVFGQGFDLQDWTKSDVERIYKIEEEDAVKLEDLFNQYLPC